MRCRIFRKKCSDGGTAYLHLLRELPYLGTPPSGRVAEPRPSGREMETPPRPSKTKSGKHNGAKEESAPCLPARKKSYFRASDYEPSRRVARGADVRPCLFVNDQERHFLANGNLFIPQNIKREEVSPPGKPEAVLPCPLTAGTPRNAPNIKPSLEARAVPNFAVHVSSFCFFLWCLHYITGLPSVLTPRRLASVNFLRLRIASRGRFAAYTSAHLTGSSEFGH